MRAIVTGASGVVGRYIVRELINNPADIEQVVALSRKNRFTYEDHPGNNNALLLDCYGDLQLNPIRLISQFSPTHIFHCAGDARQNAPAKDLWKANVNTTFNLLEACRYLHNKVKFIYCSSIVVNQKPINVYGASKLAGESLVEAYQGNIYGQSVRFPAVAGAGNRHGVVKAVVEKLMDKSTDILSLYTNSRKPIIYARDLAKAMIKCSDEVHHSRYQLCPTDSIYVEDIAKIAMRITNIKKEIKWLGNKLEDNNNMVYPVKSHIVVSRSRNAVGQAIQDILEEDYGNN